MKFETYQFSKRHAAVECALFVVFEPSIAGKTLIEYDPAHGIPSHASLKYRGTAAAIILPDGRFWVGVTLCSPSDPFVKATGRAKAIGRAYQAIRANYLMPHGTMVFSNCPYPEHSVCCYHASDRMKAILLEEIKMKRLTMAREAGH